MCALWLSEGGYPRVGEDRRRSARQRSPRPRGPPLMRSAIIAEVLAEPSTLKIGVAAPSTTPPARVTSRVQHVNFSAIFVSARWRRAPLTHRQEGLSHPREQPRRRRDHRPLPLCCKPRPGGLAPAHTHLAISLGIGQPEVTTGGSPCVRKDVKLVTVAVIMSRSLATVTQVTPPPALLLPTPPSSPLPPGSGRRRRSRPVTALRRRPRRRRARRWRRRRGTP